LPKKCKDVDQAMAALVMDLKQRGLLEDTLVIWGGEFGRTPMQQLTEADGSKSKPGRDHHKDAFTFWLAGGGVKPGITYGKTDDFGYNIAENPVHIHDLNATVLHLLGIDHERLTFKYQGRDFRLTDVHGEVVKGLLA
jgi:arylsulfatase A-like enzyme